MEAQSQLNQTLRSQFISFSIWPPTQRTRNAVIHRLIETLSTPSVLSKRYGTLSPDDASDASRLIEDKAFSIASASVSRLIEDKAFTKTPACGPPPPSHAVGVSATDSES